MRGAAKNKQVVTSGRMTGKVKVQPVRRRAIPNPGPIPCPDPAYSLYSTETEDQVTSLHVGLDRCAALLNDICHSEKTDLPSLPRAVKATGAKPRRSSTLGKAVKKPATQTDKKYCPAVRRGASSTTPRKQQCVAPAPHSGVKLHPSRKKTQPASRTFGPPTLQPSPQPTAPRENRQAAFDRDEEVPVRDVNTKAIATDSRAHARTVKVTNVRLEPRQEVGSSVKVNSAEAEEGVRTVQYLMGELKSLFGGQGSVAERLVSQLEQAVSSTLMKFAGSEADQTSLQSQNTQLHRRVRALNEQLKEREKAEKHGQNTVCSTEVLTLQEELATAQSRLQEAQNEIAEVRQALQTAQSQLRDKEAENALVLSELQATKSRLVDSERENRDLASLAQQHLEEMEHLRRALHAHDSSDCSTFIGSSVKDASKRRLDQPQRRQDPVEPAADRITHYLMSLGQPEPTYAEHRRVLAAEKDGDEPNKVTSVPLRDAGSNTDGGRPAETLGNSYPNRLPTPTQFRGDEESVLSDWSVRSASTFNTRDEAAFRDGLSALDASIASLKKTIQLDLGR